MKTRIKKNFFEVRRGRTLIIVPHLEDKVNFFCPAFKGKYEIVESQIKENCLAEPTPEKTASLVYSAYENLDKKYAKDIEKIMKDNWLWMFNTIKYVPNKGAFIQKPDKEEVFVPFGYKIGTQSSLELSKNPFVIGLFGVEGADKIIKVADKCLSKPYLYSFKNVNQEIIRNPALSDSRIFGNGLVINGDGWGNISNGYAFGVFVPKNIKFRKI